MTDVKVDPERTWVRATRIGQLVVATIFLTAGYLDLKHSVGQLADQTSRESTERTREREQLSRSVDGLREDMRKVFVDTVNARQATTWIDLFRALNKEKYPTLQIPDLPR